MPLLAILALKQELRTKAAARKKKRNRCFLTFGQTLWANYSIDFNRIKRSVRLSGGLPLFNCRSRTAPAAIMRTTSSRAGVRVSKARSGSRLVAGRAGGRQSCPSRGQPRDIPTRWLMPLGERTESQQSTGACIKPSSDTPPSTVLNASGCSCLKLD